MTADNKIVHFLANSRLLAVTLFGVLLCATVMIVATAVSHIAERQRALAESTDLLHKLSVRNVGAGGNSPQRPGSPFLEGPTLTVAGASLLQRVAGSITQVGGTIQSSQVDVGTAQAKEGFVSLSISCELEQTAIQKVLYDLEAGMPFLFVEQLDLQMPQLAGANPSAEPRVGVLLTLSGQWQGK